MIPNRETVEKKVEEEMKLRKLSQENTGEFVDPTLQFHFLLRGVLFKDFPNSVAATSVLPSTVG